MACWNAAALYSKRTLALSLGAPASSPAGAAEENKPVLLCSSSLFTVGSLALLRISGGAISVNRGAVEVHQKCLRIYARILQTYSHKSSAKVYIVHANHVLKFIITRQYMQNMHNYMHTHLHEIRQKQLPKNMQKIRIHMQKM